jgi:hypothetical protein
MTCAITLADCNVAVATFLPPTSARHCRQLQQTNVQWNKAPAHNTAQHSTARLGTAGSVLGCARPVEEPGSYMHWQCNPLPDPNWCYLVAASAAGGVPFRDEQRSLAVGSVLVGNVTLVVSEHVYM